MEGTGDCREGGGEKGEGRGRGRTMKQISRMGGGGGGGGKVEEGSERKVGGDRRG